MYYALRLTDSNDERSYPLPLDGHAKWQCVNDLLSDAGRRWQASIELPTTPSGHILVPSFSMLGESYEYQVALIDRNTQRTNRLNPLLTPADNLAQWPEKTADLNIVSEQIDCWHSEAELTNVALIITVQCERPPEKYLFAISIRPVTLTCKFAPTESIVLTQPLAISQMTAEPNLRNRICSPTSLAMVHASLTGNMAFTEIVAGCYDPATKAYGKWPLAVYQANKLNLVGAVEALPSWQCVSQVLAKQWLIVCSIRFATGSLEGAPLGQSAGHLVVLYGIDVTDPEQPHVLVMDPAGKTQDEVQRRYKLAEFSKAWLDHRGGAYILNNAPPED
tara:strand:- start:546 stop:1547 length:1002 start_codon:yes stop_codon:yes gene_type:complete